MASRSLYSGGDEGLQSWPEEFYFDADAEATQDFTKDDIVKLREMINRM